MLAGFVPSESNPSVTIPRPKPENLLFNLVCNVVLPTVILAGFSGEKWLGPKWGLVIALGFPVGYGLHDFFARRRWNFISIIGFASVLISGGFGLMKMGGFWFAVKDAAIPGIIGLAKAIERLVQELPSAETEMRRLRDRFEKSLLEHFPNLIVHGKE